MDLQIGIDLGTTNSVAAYFENGKIEYLEFRSKDSISSVIMYQDGKLIVGDKAKKKSILYPHNYIKSSKAYIGNMSKYWQIDDRIFSPTDVAKEILLEIKTNLKKHFSNIGVIEVVITVPAYFTSSQIDETKKAGEMAGFLVKQIITEPVAAAIAYGWGDNINQKIFIIDVGGGTFDTAILEVKNTVFNTLAVGGDNNLGGDDLDNVILEMFFKKIRKDKGVNLSTYQKSGMDESAYAKAYHLLLLKTEEAKIELSENENISISIANFIGDYNFSINISRDEFEKASSTVLGKIKREITQTLFSSNLSANDIDKIVLVGGSARVPAIRNFVIDIFSKNPYSDKPLDKLVAMGAAVVVTNLNTVQIRDIVSHSLGIEVAGNKFSPIILKNTKYPTSKSEIYSTVTDYQSTVSINVFEGEDVDNVHNNSPYGSFNLDNIERARKHVPKIEVTFKFDENRILHVTAKDLHTNSIKQEIIEINK